MYPIINIFGFEIQSYSLIAAIGFVVTAVVAVRLGRCRSISAEKTLMATLVSAFGIFVGGHILFALTNIKSIIKLISQDDLTVNSVLPYISGMVFYGGLFGAVIAVLIYTAVNKDVGKNNVFDIFAVSVPLFHTFGRIGCFFAGCCYGVECDFGLAAYLNTSPTHYGVKRFPVSLAEAGVNLLIFAVLLLLFKRNKLKGKLIFIYLLTYASARFVLEFFRGDSIRGFIFGFSTSQFISLLIITVLVLYFLFLYIKKRSKQNNLIE